jgi:hypothetical protein
LDEVFVPGFCFGETALALDFGAAFAAGLAFTLVAGFAAFLTTAFGAAFLGASLAAGLVALATGFTGFTALAAAALAAATLAAAALATASFACLVAS